MKKKESCCPICPCNFKIISYLLGGIGLGILITYPLVGVHPLRWGIALLLVSLACHFYSYFSKK